MLLRRSEYFQYIFMGVYVMFFLSLKVKKVTISKLVIGRCIAAIYADTPEGLFHPKAWLFFAQLLQYSIFYSDTAGKIPNLIIVEDENMGFTQLVMKPASVFFAV